MIQNYRTSVELLLCEYQGKHWIREKVDQVGLLVLDLSSWWDFERLARLLYSNCCCMFGRLRMTVWCCPPWYGDKERRSRSVYWSLTPLPGQKSAEQCSRLPLLCLVVCMDGLLRSFKCTTFCYVYSYKTMFQKHQYLLYVCLNTTLLLLIHKIFYFIVLYCLKYKWS